VPLRHDAIGGRGLKKSVFCLQFHRGPSRQLVGGSRTNSATAGVLIVGHELADASLSPTNAPTCGERNTLDGTSIELTYWWLQAAGHVLLEVTEFVIVSVERAVTRHHQVIGGKRRRSQEVELGCVIGVEVEIPVHCDPSGLAPTTVFDEVVATAVRYRGALWCSVIRARQETIGRLRTNVGHARTRRHTTENDLGCMTVRSGPASLAAVHDQPSGCHREPGQDCRPPRLTDLGASTAKRQSHTAHCQSNTAIGQLGLWGRGRSPQQIHLFHLSNSQREG
jgi:hypothetical protein